jgi:hypothetical protein
MAQLQHQLLSALCSVYGESVDLLSLGAPPVTARQWLQEEGLRVNVLDGFYPLIARLNTMLWYGGGVVLCNKLRWVDRFHFPFRTPLPRSWIERYDMIVCYYPWSHRLLRLERAGSKVVADLGDVMADRHERIGVRRWISLTAEEEKAIFQSDGRCVAVSDADAQEFERQYGVRPAVLGFVPPEFQQLMELDSNDRPPRIGFMGAPSYGNEEIMRLLAHPEFLGCISEAGIELLVAGGICDTIDPSVLCALERGGARILGRVRSTSDYYRQISATVNPIGPSTGVKIKSIETLIAGRSLITTRWGADSSLCAAFPGQVVYTEWPIEPQAFGRLAIRVVRAPLPGSASAARAYVEKSTQTLREMHTI